ncbi:MAG: TRAP transporter small permease [Alphaproteobacteria bacterium]|nr:TRAP transporter small permease [Alphaproteobacteria bacterium]MCW5743516.1 TRAP transporter small permease [Alphaproteobacteria bacterium]
MHELAVLAIVVVAILAATTFVAGLAGRILRRVEVAMAAIAAAIALFAMAFVGAEVLMRYAFDAPIPGHLEGSELLMPIIVFLALSYTQSMRGHVGMDLALDMLSPRLRRYAVMGTLLVSIFICAIIGWFSARMAYQLWLYDDVTMSPPYFKTWPSAAAIVVGYALISLRMYLQFLHLWNPDRFPANEPEGGGIHAVE